MHHPALPPSNRTETTAPAQGLQFSRHFSSAMKDPYSQVVWAIRDACIKDTEGKVIFEQKNVEFPEDWSQTAVNVVAQKYFRHPAETSLRQLIRRVVSTITGFGQSAKYFASPDDAMVFHDELVYMLLHQLVSFNSPVWFNVGVEANPQASACFINSVGDSMNSILELAKTEGMLFKYGSGTGTNLSPIRSSYESVHGGSGRASGPVSFMRGFDAFAGAIKSGGVTRRSAKMVMLDIAHPDVIEFIECKAKEEKKAHALIDAGFDGGFNISGGAYDTISYQNGNNSVRVSDDFMKAVESGKTWTTKLVTTGADHKTYPARALVRKMAQAAWECGDPGIQYDTTINDWHTCSVTDRIRSSNPCSEYMFLDDSACNLASLNLLKFDTGRSFQSLDFKSAVQIVLTAMEILVGSAGYPTERIAKNSHKFRPLGLGYCNLGALLMRRGLGYDSVPARRIAAEITSQMAANAYEHSAIMARHLGPCEGFTENRGPFLDVLRKHRRAAGAEKLNSLDAWDHALQAGEAWGYRNSQVTVLAPTGTIAFMMDCDTTGVEPDIALVKYKRLVGGGTLKLVNQSVPTALQALGYASPHIDSIAAYIQDRGTIEGAPYLKVEHLPVFDCAFKPENGERSISWQGHIRMMSAVQPFLSGAISKTVNLPSTATVEDIEQVYFEGWRLGLKAIAVYRDGCKRTQPLSTSAGVAPVTVAAPVSTAPARRRLPPDRNSVTHKFSIAGHEGYITAGMYDDGTLGEIFVRMAKEGSTLSGVMDAFATAVSLGLQHGAPVSSLTDKFKGTRFEPSGFTGNPDIRITTSICDYLARWIERRWGAPTPSAVVEPQTSSKVSSHAPLCSECGTVTVPNGSCHKCPNCGSTTGCS